MTASVAALLSVRQRRILDFIRDYYTEHGYAPSLRDIGPAVGLTAPSAVRYQVDELVRMGWIRKTPGIPRSLVVLDPATGGE